MTSDAAIDLGWVEQALGADPPTLTRLLGAWLTDAIVASGAERGFLVGSGDAGVLAARDVDGDRLTEPATKLPVAAVEEARRIGAAWRGAGTGGRGAVWSAPVGSAVAVLQNRFVPDAFEGLEVAPDPARALLLLELAGLRWALTDAERRAREAESARREDSTRSTEEILRLRRVLESTREQLGPSHAYERIIYRSSAMRRMLRLVDRVVDSDLPVYIHGESGTGKELVARALHEHGARARGPFVAQNCGAIPRTLFESEFFGHERGAFTGAERRHEGLFQRAHGGTLFLDEIGDLPLDLQAKLLRVLETGEVRPVGSQRSYSVDVRVICATHKDLRDLVAERGFREDLYYRLNVVRIDLPPLRERPDDVLALVEHFVSGLTGPSGDQISVADGVMRALVAADWPGNVRQLENEVTRAALLSDGEIRVSDLSVEVREAGRRPRGGASSRGGGSLARAGLERGTLKERVDRLEAMVLQASMEAAQNNKSAVARELGLSRAGLNMKLKRLGLWEQPERA